MSKQRTVNEADSMQAAAARLGCSITDLKRAKKAGCEAFYHGRVLIEPLRKWLEENPPSEEDESEEALKKRKLLAQCVKLEREEAIARGEYTHNSEVVRIATAWSHQVRSEFLSLQSEAPTWQGLDAPSLQERAKQFITGALSRLGQFDSTIKL